jgi:thiol-disulfide isomerase/thioredoxin
MSNPSPQTHLIKRFLWLSWPVWFVVGSILFVNFQKSQSDPEIFYLMDMGTHLPVAASEFQGKIVYVDVWASWCVPCRESMPHAQALSDQYAARGLAVIGINQDTDMVAAYQFLNLLKINFQQLGDPTGEFMMAQNIDALPTVLVFDRMGQLRHRYVGYTEADRATIDAEVLALLEE